MQLFRDVWHCSYVWYNSDIYGYMILSKTYEGRQQLLSKQQFGSGHLTKCLNLVIALNPDPNMVLTTIADAINMHSSDCEMKFKFFIF